MTDGYIIIKLHPDDFFYPMTNSVGLVREHRLIMAQFLRRCLLPWEIVHHKGTKYPSGSIENRSDNRLENLELIKGDTRHLPYTALVRNNNKLRQRIEYLEAENAGLKSQNQ